MRYCTSAGHAHMFAEQAALGKKVCANKRENLNGNFSNSVRENEMSEFQEVMRVQGHDAARLATAAEFLAEHKPAPEPTNFEQVRVGHQITIEYEDKGKTVLQHYVLGGDNEPDIFEGATCVNYEAPLGMTLLGKCVDEELTIKVNRKEHDATVVAIGLPTVKALPELRQVA